MAACAGRWKGRRRCSTSAACAPPAPGRASAAGAKRNKAHASIRSAQLWQITWDSTLDRLRNCGYTRAKVLNLFVSYQDVVVHMGVRDAVPHSYGLVDLFPLIAGKMGLYLVF